MTAQAQMRAMLDQLMGTARNGEEEKIPVKFDDPQVCKSFLLGCCPHEILTFTKMDLGHCPRIHNVAHLADYELASKSKDYFFDLDALDHLSNFIAEVDRKAAHDRGRIEDIKEEISEEVAGKAEKVTQLAKEIEESLAKAEQLGATGKVEESLKMTEKVEKLRRAKFIADREFKLSVQDSARFPQQKLRVCDVCCAHLGIYDNDLRLADHFGGRLHLGFIKIRETLHKFQENGEHRRRKREEESGGILNEKQFRGANADGGSGSDGGGSGYQGNGKFWRNVRGAGMRGRDDRRNYRKLDKSSPSRGRRERGNFEKQGETKSEKSGSSSESEKSEDSSSSSRSRSRSGSRSSKSKSRSRSRSTSKDRDKKRRQMLNESKRRFRSQEQKKPPAACTTH